ncbi:MAG TPA: GGDEF domain-containing protein, partial [Acidimicrobiales bacterium]|nr:GGDEF domain-containing protein [Acidimicrobiales bacterium]
MARAVEIGPATGAPRRRHRHGISAYLVGTFGLTMAFLLAVLGTTTLTTFNRARQNTLAGLQSSATVQAQALSDGLSTIVSYLQSTVSGPEIASLDPARCSPVLAGLDRTLSNAAPMAIVRSDLQVVCASEPRLATPGAWQSAAHWISQVSANGKAVIEPGFADIVSGKPAVLVAAPVQGLDGSHAFIVATLPFALLFSGPSSSFPTNEVYLVLSSDRSTIYSRHPGGASYAGQAVGAAGIGRVLPGGPTSVLDVDGQQRIYREATVKSTGWHLLVGITPAAGFATARGDLRRSLILGGLMVATVVGLGLLLYRRLARPVRHLRMVIEAAGSDSNVRAALEGPAEIAAVAEAFNATLAERQEFERQLSHQALHDPLTGLPNRTLLTDRLQSALARQKRGGGLVAVAFLDLDRFKLVNDAHGHPAGDQLLVALGRRLAAVVRPDDTVARFGGDEFVVLSEGLASEAEAVTIAARVTDALQEPFSLKAGEIFLSGSIGLAIASGGEEPDDLIRNADAAMYQAKTPDSASIAVYDEQMHVGVLSRLDTERDLHRAL